MLDITSILPNIYFSLINLIAFELILSILFYVDDNGNIKENFKAILHKLNPYIKTEIYIFSVIVLSFIYYLITNIYQDQILSWLSTFNNWKILVLILAQVLLDIFWISKVVLRREWTFRLCIPSLALAILLYIIGIFM